MSCDTLTVAQLRDELDRLPALDGDFTNVTELRIRPVSQRVQVVAIPEEADLEAELRSLMSACAREREALGKLRDEKSKLRAQLAKIRARRRTRPLNLP